MTPRTSLTLLSLSAALLTLLPGCATRNAPCCAEAPGAAPASPRPVAVLADGMCQMAEENMGALPRAGARSARIEVIGFEGCPNLDDLLHNTREAAARVPAIGGVQYVDRQSLQPGDGRRGWPSPSILVDGHDLFGLPGPGSPVESCRIYEGCVPGVEEIAAALRAACAEHRCCDARGVCR